MALKAIQQKIPIPPAPSSNGGQDPTSLPSSAYLVQPPLRHLFTADPLHVSGQSEGMAEEPHIQRARLEKQIVHHKKQIATACSNQDWQAAYQNRIRLDDDLAALLQIELDSSLIGQAQNPGERAAQDQKSIANRRAFLQEEIAYLKTLESKSPRSDQRQKAHDARCLLEARLASLSKPPVAVTSTAKKLSDYQLHCEVRKRMVARGSRVFASREHVEGALAQVEREMRQKGTWSGRSSVYLDNAAQRLMEPTQIQDRRPKTWSSSRTFARDSSPIAVSRELFAEEKKGFLSQEVERLGSEWTLLETEFREELKSFDRRKDHNRKLFLRTLNVKRQRDRVDFVRKTLENDLETLKRDYPSIPANESTIGTQNGLQAETRPEISGAAGETGNPPAGERPTSVSGPEVQSAAGDVSGQPERTGVGAVGDSKEGRLQPESGRGIRGSVPLSEDRGAGKTGSRNRERPEPGSAMAEQPGREEDSRQERQGSATRGRVTPEDQESSARAAAAPDTQRERAFTPAVDERSSPSNDPPRRNFQVAHPEELGAGGEVTKTQNNIAAIRTLKSLIAENRPATHEEQATLARYVGWGGLKGVFEQGFELHNRFNGALRELLTTDEYAAARRSTQYAHYTSPEVVQAIWKMTERLGFAGGQVIEPAMGIGNFFGLMPPDLATKSHLIGVESDPVAGAMAKYLYPEAQVAIKKYQDVMIPDNSLDLAVGNVPFSRNKVADRHYDDPKLSLHNYFVIRTLDKLKPGAGMAMISSRYSLDAQLNTTARQRMADRADLVAAIRLPENAFKKNAGTEVVTDLLIFRKRSPGELPNGESFERVVEVEKGIFVNEYFSRHPEHVLGRHSLDGTMYGAKGYTVRLPREEFTERLQAAIDSLPQNVFNPQKQQEEARSFIAIPDSQTLAPDHLKEGAFALRDGWIKRRVDGVLTDLPKELDTATMRSRLRAAINLRDQLKTVLQLQLETSDDEIVKPEREKLNRLYDQYVRNHGCLHGPKTSAAFREDPEYPLLLSLENYDPESKSGSKAAVFHKRTASPYEPLRKESFPQEPKAGLSRVLAATGRVDLDLISELSNTPTSEILSALESDNLIYKDAVSGVYVTADEYLSGDVRQKLKDAQAAAEMDSGYLRNVAALEKAQPARLGIHYIDPKLGQTWIPDEAYVDFIKYLARTEDGDAKVSRLPGTEEWVLTLQKDFPDFELRNTWAAGGWTGKDLVEASLNQRMPTCYKLGNNNKPVFDPEATLAAREMQQKIRHEFKDWARSSDKWAKPLEDIYNDTFNNIKLRDYDGAHLAFPGMNPEINLFPHQRNFAWRVIQDGRAMAAHVVGAGKTFETIAAATEMRRMGLSRKNMFVVPNNMLAQWRDDWQTLYPGANVLAVTDRDFSAKNRQRLLSRVATGDYDGIILTQSAFDLLSVSPEREQAGINKELEEAREVLQDLNIDKEGNRRSIKALERTIEAMEERFKALSGGKKDDAIFFDQLGVTTLFVDEAHNYKNLVYFSRMGQVSGLANSPAQRASRMKMKTDFMLETYKNRGVVFMTATPITNTLGEVYNMNRYLAPELLEKAGIRNFDDWAANFGTVETAYEYSPDGVTLKPKNRFSEFTNVPELQTLFSAFADVKLREDLPQLKVPKATFHNVLVPITHVQNPMLESIVFRGEALSRPRSQRPDPKEDNWLKLSSDARKMSLDPRLYNHRSPDGDYKAAFVARKAHEIWKSTEEQKGTQLIFCDFFTNQKDGEVAFNLFQDIKKKLVALGVPPSEIAVIQDFDTKVAKERAYRKMREGEIRILMGSTEKMGVGVNVQKRLKALHHLDQPWRPSDVEQRQGRIIRQGNDWSEIDIYRYISEPQKEKIRRMDPRLGREIECEPPKAYDLQMFQKLETKQTYVNQFMSNSFKQRSMEDPGGAVVLDFATMKAVSTGNPGAMRKVQLTHEVSKLYALQRQFDSEQSRRRFEIRWAEQEMIPVYERRIRELQVPLENWRDSDSGKTFSATIDGRRFSDRREAAKYLEETNLAPGGAGLDLYGIHIPVRFRSDNLPNDYYLGGRWHDFPPTPSGILSSVENRLRFMDEDLESCRSRLEDQRKELQQLQRKVEECFPHDKRLVEAEQELEAVNISLGLTADGRPQPTDKLGDGAAAEPEAEESNQIGQAVDAESFDKILEQLRDSGFSMANGATLTPAKTDEGIYPGRILYLVGPYCVQEISPRELVVHNAISCQEELLHIGQTCSIQYCNGIGSVLMGPNMAQLNEQGREAVAR
jgi:N12 class adenine-specific DNA methylase